MSLYSEPDHVLQLITGLLDQQKAQQHCDVLLQHGRTVYPVHAAVFYIFCGGPSSCQKLPSCETIDLSACKSLDSSLIDNFILYLYTGNLHVDQTNKQELNQLADFVDCSALKQKLNQLTENLTSKPLRFETETLRLKKILNLSRINETSKMLELHQEKLETKNLKSESEITEEILKLETSLNEAKHIPCKTDFQELKEKTDSYKPKRPCSKPWKAEKPENTKKIKKNKCLRDSNEEITPQLENENKKFECNYCGKKFRFKHCLRNHEFIHKTEKKFLCEECGFSTQHFNTMKTHRQGHSGEYFRCTLDKCSFKTFRRQNLTEHMKTHSNATILCDICDTKFAHLKNLRRHMKMHDKSGTLTCPYSDKGCSFTYLRTDKLKLHLGRIHKKHISSSSDKLVISSNIPTKSIHLQLKTLPSTREKSQPSAQVRPKFHFETVNQKTEIKLDSVRPKINLDSVRPEISLESLRPEINLDPVRSKSEINLDPVRSKSEINLDLDRPEINLNPTKRHKEINLNFKISGDHNLAGGICMDTLKFIGPPNTEVTTCTAYI
ncbi:zinc finger protein 33B isoform X4 [Eurytemora carolleeae]|uniref:zinc finger protein 33B isoform X3 n=1 Tax=Eurytemora carolleeae TaxID=1294199 RepID=UPI000C77C360|nr:zinc finger protein 33B isoform X3 [Eurytemora carolleeae]XP_023348881.1 zinc finger protein 33B isoform X4 [Eurytemora carolleeae]|eukprot:XP_023348875.1 zinc finger protein 33B-like isoform X3 [Eurytemora affinis]